MEKDHYLISILGEQRIDGETDKIEVLTAGNFMKNTTTSSRLSRTW